MCFLTVKALNEARLEASVRPYGETSFKSQWPSPFALVSGVLIALSFLKYFYGLLEWFAVVAVVAGVYPILAKAVASVTRFRLDINALTLIAGKTSIFLLRWNDLIVQERFYWCTLYILFCS